MDLREVGYDGREWIKLAQDRNGWRAYAAWEDQGINMGVHTELIYCPLKIFRAYNRRDCRVDWTGDTDGRGISEMVFGEMWQRIRRRLPDICLTIGENLGKPNQVISSSGNRTRARTELLSDRQAPQPTELRRWLVSLTAQTAAKTETVEWLVMVVTMVATTNGGGMGQTGTKLSDWEQRDLAKEAEGSKKMPGPTLCHYSVRS
ncbi:hypothetical protein ANN_21695 [Periplaneta americana]|uniref:Uncharacterized protein n=1 Tax=Periplaneta americana TaxID=6978 RepID=A0ABQ8S6M7_PERAM|nr:hypothetical protein ANN_21695 [Periplaneta americana]